jgi:hypothetical protein
MRRGWRRSGPRAPAATPARALSPCPRPPQSATRNVSGRVLVAVYFRRQDKQHQHQHQQQQRGSDDAVGAFDPSERAGGEAPAAASPAPAAGQQLQQQPQQQQQQERPPAPVATAAATAAGGNEHERITCADVLLALRDAADRGGGFGTAELARFVRAMHVGSDALSEDYVMV